MRTDHTELLQDLDLKRPDMAPVKASVDASDDAGALASFLAHLRSRKIPIWRFDPAQPPNDADRASMALADDALAHRYTRERIPHLFGSEIDWTYNPTAEPNQIVNHEWTWQLSRQWEWVALAQAYLAANDSR